MPRPAQNRLSPWIEALILSYDSHQDSTGTTSGSGWLKAHVIGVGHLSQSQAQGSDSPGGLLFLSDGLLQIPAILTASAWELLQENEDRESFNSLVNATVRIQDYQLQFHMAHDQTKCRFFLSIGDLATTAAGPVKDNTPSCTTLQSVRQKIYKTWRFLQGQERQESQSSQCGFDLSELLGEWQDDCMQAVLEDVKKRLMTASSRCVSPQPSTSTCTRFPTLPDKFTATTWDEDRIRYKGLKSFTVPVKCLLIPDVDAGQRRAPQDVANETASGLSAASEDRKQDQSQMCKPSETTQRSVEAADWQMAKPAALERNHDSSQKSSLPAEDSLLLEDAVRRIDSDIRPLSNPWDLFPPPCSTSPSSDSSSDVTPSPSVHSRATAAESKADHAAVLVSTQLPTHSSKEHGETSEHSFLLPYQKPQPSPGLLSSELSLGNPQEPFTISTGTMPATVDHCAADTAQLPPSLQQKSHVLEKDTEWKHRKAKRKRCELAAEERTMLLDEDKEVQISTSPPSWLFDTQGGSVVREDGSQQHAQAAGTVLRRTPTVHSDGTPFSYSYQVSGQNLQDFSKFRVTVSWLHWAVKYLLLPKQTGHPQNTTVPPSQTSSDRTKVTSL